MKTYDLVIIGGGPAGMAAALAAYRKNPQLAILIIERDRNLGGILNQCIHDGFGLHHFKKQLTGPEYSELFIEEIRKANIECLTGSMVLKVDCAQSAWGQNGRAENSLERSLESNLEQNNCEQGGRCAPAQIKTAIKTVHAINNQHGYMQIPARAIVLAMGCRERTRGAIRIHGARVAGVYTAGTAQHLINIDGYMPGKKAVILGSGDIGLIMAQRMILEGAKVEAVVELLPHSNGLTRNIVQCLHDYDIPLLLSHTVTRVHGQHRVTGVTIAKVDDALQPIEATERFIACDTLLLSVGLVPENEISRVAGIAIDNKTGGAVVGELRQTSVDGVFACGNVLQVHDLVDFVSEEGALAGEGAAQYVAGNFDDTPTHVTRAGDGISYVVPHKINAQNLAFSGDKVKLFMRVNKIYADSIINAYLGDKLIASKKGSKFLPAEMVSFVIKKEDLQVIKGTRAKQTEEEIVVRVESAK